MTVNQRMAVVCTFSTREQAESAMLELRSVGFGDNDIGFAMRDDEPKSTLNQHDHVHYKDDVGGGEGTAAGAVTGGVVAGALAAGMIPGVGPVLIGGLLAGIVGGVVVGAVTGGIAASLIHLGVPEDDAHYYQDELHGGHPVVSVHTTTRLTDARDIMLHNGGRERAIIL